MKTGAKKNDQNYHEKPPVALINKTALFEEAKVMAYGATKYELHNWKKEPVLSHTRLASAALRHILQFLDGEDNDSDTGLSHLAHARCSLGFLLYYIEKGIGDDDR